MSVDGRTALVGLIGDPVSHSLSPRIHNAAFAERGLPWLYLPLRVEAARLGEATRGLRALGFRGANVTIPHKAAVLPFLDDLTPLARRLGAVNTIKVSDGGALIGDNTDAPGLSEDWSALAFPTDRPALILGAGGAARAAAEALIAGGCRHLTLVNRSRDRAEAIAALCKGRAAVSIAEAIQAEAPALDELGLIINATPLGMRGALAAECPWPPDLALPRGAAVYDLVYAPARTPLLLRAEAAGLRCANGLGMLARQGARAWSWWTGQAAPLALMLRVLEEALDESP